MKPPETKPAAKVQPDATASRDSRWLRWRAQLNGLHFRDVWWQFLNQWEAHRWLRRSAYGLLAAAVLAAGLWLWAYPAWIRRNAIKMSREWIAAGNLLQAAEMVQKAMSLMPDEPEPWQLAAELCRLSGLKLQAVGYASRAARLAPDNPDLTLGWAAEALRANLPEEADKALDKLPPEVFMHSPVALRLRGELARRQLRLSVARGCFETALRLEGPLAINEVPLGLILIRSTEAATRQRGLALLTKWTGDLEWGPAALRTLLEDAVAADDRPAMRQWSEALRAHPRCTVGDMPNCLFALGKADENRYREVLAGLERDHAVTPQAAAQLLGWLNQIGRHADAVRWLPTLPAPAMQQPPLAVLAAEALRVTAGWAELADRTGRQNWGTEFEFLRWAYAREAALALGQSQRAGELWLTLFNHTRLNSVHGLFVAANLYSWGRTAEAEQIWWQVSENGGKTATDSLAALARHYQLQRDAEGQYRTFRQLHFLKPEDAAIGNNYAFFALLTGRDQRIADEITRANLAAAPANEAYVATRTFAILRHGRAADALALIAPLGAQSGHSPAVAFAYGLALAANHRKDEARPLLNGLPPESLTLREVELIKSELQGP